MKRWNHRALRERREQLMDRPVHSADLAHRSPGQKLDHREAVLEGHTRRIHAEMRRLAALGIACDDEPDAPEDRFICRLAG